MINGYWPLILQIAFGLGFALLVLTLAHAIKPKLRKRAESNPDTFECGVPYAGDAKGIFNVKFYMVAVLFIIFDIEAIFLFPWAVGFSSFKQIGLSTFILIEMLVFLLVLILGYFYILKKGGLDWESPNINR